MPWIAVGASIFGSNIGSEHFIGLAGAGAATGVVLVLFEWLPALIIQALSWAFLPVFISAGVYTLPEYMERRFGGKRIRIYLSILSLFLHIVSRLASTLFSGAIYIQLALNWNMYPSIIGLLFITGVFTIAGGLTAVMYTDTAQSIIIVIGAFVVMGLSLDKIGGYENLIPAYMNATPSVGTENTTCGLPRPDAMSVLRDASTGDYPWPSMILQCGLVSAWYWVCDQIMVQRCLAARNISHAKGGTLLGGYLKILPLFIMIIPGMVSRILFTEEVACVDPEVCKKACDNPIGCSNIAYPKLVLELLPEGARGLIMAAMLSAIVTSLTSIFNSSSTVFTMDLWRRFRPNANQRELLIVGRSYIIVLCIITILWIPVVKAAQGGQLFTYIVVVEGFIAAPLPILFLFAVFWDRCTEKGAFIGIVATHVIGVIRLILEIVYPVPHCGEPDNRPVFLSKIHSFYFSQIMMLIQVILVLIISVLTQPRTKEEINGTTWSTRLHGGSKTDISETDELPKPVDVELKLIVKEQSELESGQNEKLMEEEDIEIEMRKEKTSALSLVRMCLIICGIKEVTVESRIEIPVEKRKAFLTETSAKVQAANKFLAILLIATIAFLIGYFK